MKLRCKIELENHRLLTFLVFQNKFGVKKNPNKEVRFRFVGFHASLAILCNSMVIEMYSDTIRVSHGFQNCQLLVMVIETEYVKVLRCGYTFVL